MTRLDMTTTSIGIRLWLDRDDKEVKPFRGFGFRVLALEGWSEPVDGEFAVA